jgi:Ras-related C3 botulinum toxin substrate 1
MTSSLCPITRLPSRPQLENVTVKWVPEIRHHCADVPIVLIGTKSDLRDDRETVAALAASGQSVVRREQALKVQHKIKAVKYVECSALTQRGLKHVFDEAVRAVLSPDRRHELKRKKCKLM